ncbi:MAG: VTT domain-containing protein [Alphaproteobacteria bacterium]|nr:VTT domain-containing protein [Alphaproteobacteria bacterium]
MSASIREDLDLRQTALRMMAGLGVMMLIIGLVAVLFLDVFKAMGAWFVGTLGPLGVGLGFFIPDALTLPVPHEGIVALAVAGGMNFWVIGSAACTGSIIGGSTGWLLGKKLSGTDLFYRVMGNKGPQARALMQRYGDRAVIIAAVSPIPYSLMAWSAGALGMGFRRFVWLSLWRIPRVFFYLWLIEAGLVSLGS